jgi:hypothetical protein
VRQPLTLQQTCAPPQSVILPHQQTMPRGHCLEEKRHLPESEPPAREPLRHLFHLQHFVLLRELR